MTYISIADVRRASGVPTSLLNDSTIEAAIPVVERFVERWLNARFRPTLAIEIHDGTGTDRMFVKQNPLLSVRAVKIEDTSISVDRLKIYKQSGKILLDTGAEQLSFIQKNQSIKVKYLHGWVEPQRDSSDDFQRTESTADVTAGSSVEITVDSITGFAVGDFVEITGMDGNNEVATITATSAIATSITVDILALDHEEDSFVTKVAIPYYIKRFMEVESAIYVAVNAIGSTYTFNASYSIGELSVVKGVPHTHWQASYEKNAKERDNLRKIIRPRMNMRAV